MTENTVQPISRAQVIHLISDGITNGLPAPQRIHFLGGSLEVKLDSIADRAAWQPTFGLAGGWVNEQPYPLDVPPGQFKLWTTQAWGPWRGWQVTLVGDEPPTDEQRRWWVESGKAAERAEYVASQKAES